jgi:2-amino-4-hydroxy-6-hydroxymethyldihydropteridine diphosphokinase
MVCFSLGSNLGDKLGYMQRSVNLLREAFGEALLMSSVYETEGWKVENHPTYLNAVICFNTLLPPEEVLEKVLTIEKKQGRIRTPGSVDPRTIDIDLLFYNNMILKKENLIIPHPLLKYRKFVLLPLAEIMGDYLHPELGVSINELLERCEDLSGVSKTELSLAQS